MRWKVRAVEGAVEVAMVLLAGPGLPFAGLFSGKGRPRLREVLALG